MTDTGIIFMMRIFWAVFMALMLIGGYRGSCNVENGKATPTRVRTDDSLVWLDPLVFPVVIGVMALIMCLFLDGEMLAEQFFSYIFDTFFFLNLYFLFLMLFLPLLRKYYTAKMCATLWLVPIFLYYQPYIFYQLSQGKQIMVCYIPKEMIFLLLGIWLLGFAVFMLWQILSHVQFSRLLKKDAGEVEDPELRGSFEREKKKLNFSEGFTVELKYSNRIKTPLTVGMIQKNMVIYLPRREYTTEEAAFIFRHELCHIRRRDTHTKFFLRFCNAFGWMHPFAWIAVKRAEDDLELSCDELVLKDENAAGRRVYANLLLTDTGVSSGFTTCLSRRAKTLRYRMRETMQEKKKRRGLWILFLVMFLSCFFPGRMIFATDRTTLGEVLGEHIHDIKEVTYTYSTDHGNQKKPKQAENREELLEYLSDLEIEKLIGDYEVPYQEEGLSIFLETKDQNYTFVIAGEYIECYVFDVSSGENSRIQYHVVDKNWFSHYDKRACGNT